MAAANRTQLGLGGRLARPFVKLYQFFQAVWFELQRVVWPSKEETWTFTLVVIMAVVIVAAYMAGLDVVLSLITNKLIGIQ
jgi:preprotein translocase subunit SecE